MISSDQRYNIQIHRDIENQNQNHKPKLTIRINNMEELVPDLSAPVQAPVPTPVPTHMPTPTQKLQ